MPKPHTQAYWNKRTLWLKDKVKELKEENKGLRKIIRGNKRYTTKKLMMLH